MRSMLALAIVLALVVTAVLLAAEPRSPQGMPSGMKQYFVGLIYRGAEWTPEVTPEREAIQAAHLANIRRLAEAGKLVLVGPFGDDGDLRGLFFFDVPTLEEAEALVQTDPAVQAGKLRVELHPWWGTDQLPKVLQLHAEAERRRQSP